MTTGTIELGMRPNYGAGKFFVETFQGGPNIDARPIVAAEDIFNDTFRPVLRRTLGDIDDAEQTLAYSTAAMRSKYSHPATRLVLLRLRESGEVVGFTSSFPVTLLKEQPEWEKERMNLKLRPAGYTALQRVTVTVGDTAITPENRGQGGWTLMMDELDRGIAEQEKYFQMVRTPRVAGKYADKVNRRYGGNPLYKSMFDDTYGRMRYFRFRI